MKRISSISFAHIIYCCRTWTGTKVGLPTSMEIGFLYSCEKRISGTLAWGHLRYSGRFIGSGRARRVQMPLKTLLHYCTHDQVA